MKIFAIVAILFAGLIGISILVCGLSYVTASNTGNASEQGLLAANEASENTLSQFTTAVQEAAQVPAMQRDDMAKLIQAAIQGRYGSGGSKAVFQAIQEQNPNVSPELYTKLQTIIEAGHNDFKNAQNAMIDKKRAYNTLLGSVWTGFWLRLAGYPKVDMNQFKIVVDDDTAEAFKTKKQKVIQLRPSETSSAPAN